MPDPRVRLLLNPRAGAGAASRRLPDIMRALHQADLPFEIARTAGPGDATKIARTSFDDGIDIVAVVGGDGTLNEVVQAYISHEGTAVSGPEIAYIPIGTGGDFRRTMHMAKNIDGAIRAIRSGTTKLVDIVVTQLTSHDNQPATKAFINVTSFGIGGVTDHLVNSAPKWLGGKASFFIGAARAFARYQNQHVQVRVDDELFYDGPIFNVALANGRFFGGGMMIAPEADPCDGLMDVVCLGDFTRRDALQLSSKIYDGSHVKMDKVTSTKATRVHAQALRANNDVLIDMDGETPGKLPLSAYLLPKGLRVRV